MIEALPIVLLDRNFDRAEQLALRFVEAGATVTLLSDSDRYEDSDWYQSWLTRPMMFQLGLVHESDGEEWERLALNCAHIVYYTGGKPPAKDCYIQRRMTAQSGILTIEEAQSLMAWATGTAPKPSVLLPRKSMGELTALAILCQGYDAVMQQAEWKAQQALVSDRAWWRQTLQPVLPQLKQALAKNSAPGIEQLLETIFEEPQAAQISPEQVEAAQQDLQNFL